MTISPSFRSRTLFLACFAAAAALFSGCASSDEGAPVDEIPRPGLSAGDRAPDAALITIDGKTVNLASMYPDGPVIVTFYRGGWCPFCNRALAGWQDEMENVRNAGATFVAITPESPANATKTIEKDHLSYTVLSDTSLQAAKAFKVHFQVDDRTRERYKGYGIDLARSNASGTWELPAPATFVVDRSGVIRYVFADWDYQKRADPDEVIAEVKKLTGK